MPGWILASGGNEFSDIYAEADLAALEKRKNKTYYNLWKSWT